MKKELRRGKGDVKMKLRNGWLKEQMKKVKKEVENWPEWMKKLAELEEKMEKMKRKESLVSKTGNWYERCIEKPIRPLVRLLRDNGFNTECSCGHQPEPYVQCEYMLDGEIKRLHDLLFNNGYRNYTIDVYIRVMDGHLYPHIDIKIEKGGET